MVPPHAGSPSRSDQLHMAHNILRWLLRDNPPSPHHHTPIIRRIAMSPTAAFVLPRGSASIAATLLGRATGAHDASRDDDPASATDGTPGFGQSPMDALSDADLLAWRDALLAAASARPQPASSAAVASLPDCTDDVRAARDPNLVCSVCRDGLDDDETLRWTRLPCQHTFHRECVEPWLANHAHTCPNCRFPLERASDAGEATSHGPAPDLVPPPPQRTAATVFSVLDQVLRHPPHDASAPAAAPAAAPASPADTPDAHPASVRPHLAMYYPIRRIFSLRFEVAGLPEGALTLGRVRADGAGAVLRRTLARPADTNAPAVSPPVAAPRPMPSRGQVAPPAPLAAPPAATASSVVDDGGSPARTIFGRRREARRKRSRDDTVPPGSSAVDEEGEARGERVVRPRTRSSLLPPLAAAGGVATAPTGPVARPSRTLSVSPACRTEECTSPTPAGASHHVH
mmetsp:Transcript_1568/g.5005  ORF Transcript_1568/g.5005 Transcript_1568/m.5005 type:complete len:458 (-) Transcript_1568:38-1411(-)